MEIYLENLKKQKENKSMDNTENLKNDFVKTLKEDVTNFVEWAKTCEEIVRATSDFNNRINEVKEVDGKLVGLEKEEIKAVTTFEIDLVKEGIDVSEWEDPVKPVKAILSVMTKDENGEFALRIGGNVVFLMEDGTFRMNYDSNCSNENVVTDSSDLGKSLTEALKEGMVNFTDWANAMTTLLNSGDELKNNIETIKEFDSALTDLKKVSEETVKAATEM